MCPCFFYLQLLLKMYTYASCSQVTGQSGNSYNEASMVGDSHIELLMDSRWSKQEGRLQSGTIKDDRCSPQKNHSSPLPLPGVHTNHLNTDALFKKKGYSSTSVHLNTLLAMNKGPEVIL